MRTRTLVLLAAVMTVIPIGLAGLAQGGRVPSRVPAMPAGGDQTPPEARALTVLRHWDGRRAAAWAAGDVGRLAALYAPGSRTGRRDVADLRRWTARGLRVVGLSQQVASFRVVGRRASSVTAVVVDRTVDGIAVGAGRRTAVPTSAWTGHRIRLVRVGTRWRVAEAWAAEAQPAR